MEFKKFRFGDEEEFHVLAVGMIFYYEDGDEFYILAQTASSSLSLIGLKEGNRWADATPVEDVYNITRAEWDEITQDVDSSDFKYIGTLKNLIEGY